MKKLFLVCLMMLAGSAWAEWEMSSESDIVTYYFDPATIRKDGNMRRVWQIQDLRNRGKGGEMSARMRMEYDCKEERLRILDISEHTEPMAGGRLSHSQTGSGTWRGIAPNTNSSVMLEIVCAK